MTVDWTGISLVIVAVGAIVDRLLTQWNIRRPLKDAVVQRERIATEQKTAIDAQNNVLAAVKDNTDGALTAAKKVADAFEAEADRLRKGGPPTPSGQPGPDQPVAMQWKATVERPERSDDDAT